MLAFNSINFSIMGIPAYFFCAILSFVIASCVYIMLMASKKYDLTKSIKALFLSSVGMIVGAKLFGYLTGIYRDIGLGVPLTRSTLLDTGIVFYGGLFGAIIAYRLCIKFFSASLDIHSLDVVAVCIPLFHAIARIGCFLSGCCFGKIHSGPLAVYYTTIVNGVIDSNFRFPVQLIESIFEFITFGLLLFWLRTGGWRPKNLLMCYLAIYSSERFFIEFLRGDVRRGIICGISFSQCVSVLVWIGLLVRYSNRSANILKEDYHGQKSTIEYT